MILVTGAAGHLGNVLVRKLLEGGQQVRVLILPGEDCRSLDGLEVERIQGNILDPASLIPAFSGVKLVFHMAALVSLMESQASILQKVNVEGTFNVIRAAVDAGVKRLVYTSSIHALARPPAGVVIDESQPFDINNTAGPYDRTKALASMIVQTATSAGMDAVIVCPTGVIGPYDFRRSEMGSMILEWMEKRISFLVKGGFDFVDVRDVAQGHILAAQTGRSGETYILGGEQIGVTQLRDRVQKLSGFHTPAILLSSRAANFSAWFAEKYYQFSHSRPRFTRYSLETLLSNSPISSQKAILELGYAPRSLAESLADTVAWWQENRNKIRASVRI
jgi:dihydroflavonol-4-reductase